MSAIPSSNKKETLPKARKRGFFRNLTPFDGTNQEKLFREIEDILRENTRALDELQSFQVAARNVDGGGKPLDKERCETFDGQFIRVTQTAAAPMLVTVDHGLARTPQGAMQLLTKATTLAKVFIEGDKTLLVSPADSNRIVFQLNGSVNDEFTFIIF